MPNSSFAVRNVVSTYQRHLRTHHPPAPMRDADEASDADPVAIEPRVSARSLRERFGADAVREFRSGPWKGSRKGRDLS